MAATSEPKVIVKRKYSRAGFIECKRRKVKCDEVLPSCGICVKTGKECTYAAPKPNKKRPPVPESFKEQSSVESSAMGSLSELFSVQEPSNGRGSADMLLFENVFDDANTLVNGLLDFEDFVLDDPLSLQPQVEGRDLKLFHSNIILNGNNVGMYSSDKQLKSYLKGTDILQNPELAKSWYQFDLTMRDGDESDRKEEISNVQLTRRIVQIHGLTPVELKYFESIAVGNFVLYMFPFASNIENNEVMPILLEYLMVFKYLVYALIL